MTRKSATARRALVSAALRQTHACDRLAGAARGRAARRSEGSTRADSGRARSAALRGRRSTGRAVATGCSPSQIGRTSASDASGTRARGVGAGRGHGGSGCGRGRGAGALECGRGRGRGGSGCGRAAWARGRSSEATGWAERPPGHGSGGSHGRVRWPPDPDRRARGAPSARSDGRRWPETGIWRPDDRRIRPIHARSERRLRGTVPGSGHQRRLRAVTRSATRTSGRNGTGPDPRPSDGPVPTARPAAERRNAALPPAVPPVGFSVPSTHL